MSSHLSITNHRQYFVILSIISALVLLSSLAVWVGSRQYSPAVAPANQLDNTITASNLDFSSLPLYFEPNVGQMATGNHFVARSPGGNLSFTQSGVVLSLQVASPADSSEQAGLQEASPGETHRLASQQPAPLCQRTINLDFVDASSEVRVVSEEAGQGKVNYFIGNDPAKWHSGVPTYKGIAYKGLYEGVDLSYRGDNSQLKGTYTITPGGDPSQIGWRYTGAQGIAVDEAGDLQVTVGESGDIAGGCGVGKSTSITEQAPVAWQDAGDERTAVEVRYVIGEDGTIGFEVGIYDPTRPLIIDPYLTYSTFLGGYGGEGGSDIKVDAQGNIYVGGYTGSPSFPFTGALSVQPVPGPPSDVLLLKLRADGTGLEYATFLGGYLNPLQIEGAEGIAIDPSGHLYVTGSTNSDDFPTVNAYQPVYGGGAYDIFVAKLSPDGSQLIYSTYLNGGESLASNHGYGIAADSAGNAYVVGETTSPDFPVVNAYQSIFGGNSDAFITKFNPQGSALIYSTFLGGDNVEVALDVTLDSTNNAVVSGATYSANFPTRNALQPTFGGGTSDAFVAKLNSAGNDLVFSTYLGGGPGGSGGFIEWGNDIALDPQGNVYVGGETESLTFPVVNAVQPTFGGGSHDGFAAKITPNGSALAYSTYLGGSSNDRVNGLAADAQGRIYIAGITGSSNFPVHDAIQPTFGGGSLDAFVTSLDPSGAAYIYSSFLGGSGLDYGNGVAWHNNRAYYTGRTLSPNFPTANPMQSSLHGSFDAYIAVISDDPPATPTPTSTGTPPTATPTACGAQSDYSFSVSSGATIVPGSQFVPESGCGECIVTIPLPFPVRMYGRTFTTTYANANGYLQFTARWIQDQGQCPPSAWMGYGLMPYWDDLNAGCVSGYGIYTSVAGIAPNRIFNIEWRTQQFTFGFCGDYVNFAVKLYENSPTQQVDFVYGAIASYGGRLAVGVQMEEASYARGTSYQCSTQNLSTGTKLTFTLPACAIGTPVATSTPPTATATPTCSPGGGIGPWQSGPAGPGSRYLHASVSDGHYVYIFGGRILVGQLLRYADDAWRWNPANGEWTELANMPTARSSMSAAYYSGKIYVIGGYNAGNLNQHAVYDIASDTWTTAAPLPQARVNPASAAYNGKVYVFGGSETTMATAIYDIASNTWSAGANLETYVSAARAVTAGNYIYVSGGEYFEDAFDLLRRYDPITDSWTSMAPLGTARQAHVTMTDGTHIYVVNGGNAMPVPTPVPASIAVERYNIATNTWTYEDPVVLSSMWSGGGLAGGKLIVYGGSGAGNAILNLAQIASLNSPCATGTPITATPGGTNTPVNTIEPTSTSVSASATPTVSTTGTVLTTSTATATATATRTASPVSTVTVTPSPCAIEFNDVPPGSTFYEFVRCLACRGILGGYLDGTFRPSNNVTRGQLAKIVSNAAGFADPPGDQLYEDVPVGSTFYDFVQRLGHRDIVGGYPCGEPGEPCGAGNRPYFRPNANATRGQISKIVAIVAGWIDPTTSQTFEDVPVGSTFHMWIENLVAHGVMQGYRCGDPEPCVPPDNRPYFRPQSNATRGQTAKIVANTFFPGCDPPLAR